MPTLFPIEIRIRAGANGPPIGIQGDLGALVDGNNAAVVLAQIDDSQMTGGCVALLQAVATMVGSGRKLVAMITGHGVDPIVQRPGDFQDVVSNAYIDVNGTPHGNDLSDGGAGNVSLFSADNDYAVVEHTSDFDSIQVVLATEASEDCELMWEHKRGVSGSWTAFSPVDGTNGLRNSGVVSWEPSQFAGSGALQIRMTRTADTVTTTPVADRIGIGQGSLINTYWWDKEGDVSVRSVKVANVTDTNLIAKAIVTAKGDLIAATAAGVPTNLAVGSDKYVLIADSSESAGVKWGAIPTASNGAWTDATANTSLTPDDTWIDIPDSSFTLGSAGTWRVSVDVRCNFAVSSGTGRLELKLVNTSDSADVSNSETCLYQSNASGTVNFTTSASMLVTVASSKSFKWQARRISGATYAVSAIQSGSGGRTRGAYIKLSN